MPFVCDIFNAILNSGYYPEIWAKTIIVPIFKKGDELSVSNYRGIALMSCFSKLFTGIINKLLNIWCEQNEKLSDAQFGFRKGRSTCDAIFVLNALVNSYLNKN